MKALLPFLLSIFFQFNCHFANAQQPVSEETNENLKELYKEITQKIDAGGATREDSLYQSRLFKRIAYLDELERKKIDEERRDKFYKQIQFTDKYKVEISQIVKDGDLTKLDSIYQHGEKLSMWQFRDKITLHLLLDKYEALEKWLIEIESKPEINIELFHFSLWGNLRNSKYFFDEESLISNIKARIHSREIQDFLCIYVYHKKFVDRKYKHKPTDLSDVEYNKMVVNFDQQFTDSKLREFVKENLNLENEVKDYGLAVEMGIFSGMNHPGKTSDLNHRLWEPNDLSFIFSFYHKKNFFSLTANTTKLDQIPEEIKLKANFDKFSYSRYTIRYDRLFLESKPLDFFLFGDLGIGTYYFFDPPQEEIENVRDNFLTLSGGLRMNFNFINVPVIKNVDEPATFSKIYVGMDVGLKRNFSTLNTDYNSLPFFQFRIGLRFNVITSKHVNSVLF